MKKLKIAICFRGLIRSGILNRKTFSNFFEDEFDVDYFYHTWWYENSAMPSDPSYYSGTRLHDRIKDQGNWQLLTTKLEKYKQVYGFKLGNIQHISEYYAKLSQGTDIPLFYGTLDPDKAKRGEVFHMSFHPQYHSAFEVNGLCKAYSKSKNIDYDLVVSTRADITLDPDWKDKIISEIYYLKEKNQIGIVNGHINPTVDAEFMDDVFWIGPPDLMTEMLEHYSPKLNKDRHTYIYKHIIDSNLPVYPLRWPYAVFREFHNYLDPIEDWTNILVDNVLMHSPVDNLERLNREGDPKTKLKLNEILNHPHSRIDKFPEIKFEKIKAKKGDDLL